jgi:hypothetical protein
MSEPDPLGSFDALAYPGGRPPANRADASKAEPVESEGWDHKPVFYLMHGEEREFFTIKHLAAALGRQPVTIRSWENRGVLPKSPFRSPPPSVAPTFGSAPKGRRLWTREQIDGLLAIARACRVITDPHQKPPSSEFTAKATQLFLRIAEDENRRTHTDGK